jgi:hypothetical protein
MQPARKITGPLALALRTNEFLEDTTLYVHFNTGKVAAVADVIEVHTTDEHIVVVRKHAPPAVFNRRDVYFTCVEPDMQPAQL